MVVWMENIVTLESESFVLSTMLKAVVLDSGEKA
jgi:hypothetical protein